MKNNPQTISINVAKRLNDMSGLFTLPATDNRKIDKFNEDWILINEDKTLHSRNAEFVSAVRQYHRAFKIITDILNEGKKGKQ